MKRVEGQIRCYDRELETWLFTWTCPSCHATNESELDKAARCKQCQYSVFVFTDKKDWTKEHK